jgi:hypothetical protein
METDQAPNALRQLSVTELIRALKDHPTADYANTNYPDINEAEQILVALFNIGIHPHTLTTSEKEETGPLLEQALPHITLCIQYATNRHHQTGREYYCLLRSAITFLLDHRANYFPNPEATSTKTALEKFTQTINLQKFTNTLKQDPYERKHTPFIGPKLFSKLAELPHDWWWT